MNPNPDPTPSALHLPATAPFDLARVKAGWPVVTRAAHLISDFGWNGPRVYGSTANGEFLHWWPSGSYMHHEESSRDLFLSLNPTNPAYRAAVEAAHARGEEVWRKRHEQNEWVKCEHPPCWEWLYYDYALRSDLRPLSTETGKEVKPCALTIKDNLSKTDASSAVEIATPVPVTPRASNAPASVRTAALGQPQWHNPDNLPSPGDGKRFLVKGEMAEPPDEYWNGSIWRRVTHRHDDTSTCTYRTSASRPLPDATGEGEDVKEIRALLPTTPPASGETGTPRCDMHKVDAGWILASHSEGEFVPLEKAQAIERDLHAYRKESSDFATQIVRERQSAQAQIEASRAECEALRAERNEALEVADRWGWNPASLKTVLIAASDEVDDLQTALTAANLAREKAEAGVALLIEGRDAAFLRMQKEADKRAEYDLTTARARIAELERELAAVRRVLPEETNAVIREADSLRSSLDAVGKERDEAKEQAQDTDSLCAKQSREIAKLREELDRLKDDAAKLESWNREAKAAWGVHYHTSFDDVWKEALEARTQLAAANADRARLREALNRADRKFAQVGFYCTGNPLDERQAQAVANYADKAQDEVRVALANPTPASTAEEGRV